MTADAARVTAWVEELAQAHAAASEGPWHADGHELYKAWPGIPDMAGDWIGETCDIDDIQQSNANAAAIVAAHNNLDRLLAVVRGVAELAGNLDMPRSTEGDNGGWADGANAAERFVASCLRQLLADAAPDTEKGEGA